MQNYEENYHYINKLKNCPNCGCELSEEDKECPACSINLLGFNEQDNRFLNIEQQAQQLELLTKEGEKLKNRYNEENAKKEKANKTFKIILLTILSLIIFIILSVIVQSEIVEYAHTAKEKTYNEVVNSFE